jgi:methionyl-tRNA formyltransferase
MIKESSFRFCFGRFIDLLVYKFKEKNIYDIAKKQNIDFFETIDINNKESIDKIKLFSPDLILSTFTMHIVSEEVINLSKIQSIGTHPSILPSYKGLEVFFWQLANDEKKSGVSVFLLDKKIDSGKVFLQTLFEISDNETVESLYSRITKMSSLLLIEAIEIFEKKESLIFIESGVKESYFAMPTSKAYKKFIEKGKKWK